jgi:hypothetical protein
LSRIKHKEIFLSWGLHNESEQPVPKFLQDDQDRMSELSHLIIFELHKSGQNDELEEEGWGEVGRDESI